MVSDLDLNSLAQKTAELDEVSSIPSLMGAWGSLRCMGVPQVLLVCSFPPSLDSMLH